MISVRSARSLVRLLIAAASAAQVAQPLVTDDAAVVAPKTSARSVGSFNARWSRILGAARVPFGVVAGGARDTGAPHGSSAFQTYYARTLASWYPRNGLEIDLSLGAANVYGSGTFALAGAAIQYTAVTLAIAGRSVSRRTGRRQYQVGVRCIVIPDPFEAYVSYGNRFSGSSDQWSAIIGIRVQTAPFLH